MRSSGREHSPNAQFYRDEPSARRFLEQLLWPEGPVCPHCGSTGEAKRLRPPSRPGLYQCRICRGQFTIISGTILADSHIPLDKWLHAIDLMCGQPGGVSAMQLRRDLPLGSYRTAWMMCHRIRWAITQPPLARLIATRLRHGSAA